MTLSVYEIYHGKNVSLQPLMAHEAFYVMQTTSCYTLMVMVSKCSLLEHRPGARPTNDISIELEIRSKLGTL